MSIDRRQFVRRSSLVAGLACLPDWLTRAFTQDPDEQGKGQETRARQLTAARRRAAAWGKPLLVFVVPEDRTARGPRGRKLGAALNWGGDGFLLDLALCEVACATVDEVARQLDDVKIEGEPMLLLLEPPRAESDGESRLTPVDVELAAEPLPVSGQYAAYLTSLEKYFLGCSEKIAAAVRSAVVRDRGVLAARADRARATLTEDEHGALYAYLTQAGPSPGEELLVRAAAVVRMGAEAARDQDDRERLQKALLAAVKKVFVEQRIPGSKWARSEGCGVDIEGEKAQFSIACGMGHIPQVCQRFLYFFDQ